MRILDAVLEEYIKDERLEEDQAGWSAHERFKADLALDLRDARLELAEAQEELEALNNDYEELLDRVIELEAQQEDDEK